MDEIDVELRGGGDGLGSGGENVADQPVHVHGLQRSLPAHGGGHAHRRARLQRPGPASGHPGHGRLVRLPGHARPGHQRSRWIPPRLLR